MKEKTITILYGTFVSLMVLVLGLAYANVTTELKIEGNTVGQEQEGVYITEVEYLCDNGADTDNSKINYYLGTMLDSKVVLGSSTSSTITYKVTIKNNTDRKQVFIGIVKDETNEEVYSNTNIQPNVETTEGITGLEEYVTTIAPGETLTFPVTYAYAGTDTSHYELQGKINFRFREKPILELSNEGETYILEKIYAGYTPEEYEFTVSNYNETYTNGVPMTYTFECTLTEGSPLEAKIYDENGTEVTGSIGMAGDGTQVDHTYTLKITWDSSLDSTDYEGKSYTCRINLVATPDDTDYAEYSIEKEFGVNITTCAHSYENGACTLCGKECVHNFKCGICTICGKIATVTAGEKAEVKSEYSDGTDTAIIPKGFTVSGASTENTIDEGLVIYLMDDKTDEEIETIDWTNGTTVATLQKTYDQFVWIPVENINQMYMCQSEEGTKSCKITVEDDIAICTTHNSTSMAGRLYATSIGETYNASLTTQTYKANSGVREPDVVTSYDGNTTYLGYLNTILGISYSSATTFKAGLQSEYNEIVKSVYENKGFYIGRYETSNITTTNGTAAKVVAGVIPTTTINWYYMYAQQKDYATNKGINSLVGSTMMQGAAYDQLMKFVNTTSYSVTTYGNVGHSFSASYNSGSQSTDQSKNIFDLEGNIIAWTTEAVDTNHRTYRGGHWSYSGSASCRNSNTPDLSTNNRIGTLLQLYLYSAHTFGEWEITKSATCIEAGIKTRTCSVCGEIETETIAATDSHIYGSWVTTTAVTCTTEGTEQRTCSVCGDKQTQSIAALGHNYVNGVCTRCGSKELLSTTTPYVGYYADLEGDGTVDGVIFADLAYGATGDGQYGTNEYGTYTITKVTSGLKKYYISQESYSGKFGTKDVISPASTGTDRFYVMALEDFDSRDYYWYYYASSVSVDITATSGDFGAGRTNTDTMIAKWNNSSYGSQHSYDMWGVIQSKVKDGWFVPSSGEWSAFGEEICEAQGVTYVNLYEFGLQGGYWTSYCHGRERASYAYIFGRLY